MSSPSRGEEILSATLVLEYAYRRSLGPVLGRFFTGLRNRKLEAVKTQSGRVLVPPAEYDPETAQATTDEWVAVGPGGTVTSWTWIAEPREKHPLDRPFAFALIQLDGADTAMLHVVDSREESKMSTGMRVEVRWADETQGHIRDIAHFVPAEGT